jgi:hypothetical protein
LRINRIFERFHRHGKNGIFGLKGEEILIQKANRAVFAFADAAGIERIFIVDEFEQRRFSTPVQANQADLIIGADKSRSTLKKGPAAYEIRDIRDGNHAVALEKRAQK